MSQKSVVQLNAEQRALPLFAHQHTLPPRPLPPLDATLELYTRSLAPLLTPEELRTAQARVAAFARSPGAARLQRALEQRAATQRNWSVTCARLSAKKKKKKKFKSARGCRFFV